MNRSIAYVENNKITIYKDAQAKTFGSNAFEDYKKTMQSIKERHEWKSSGTGAAFTGQTNPAGGFSAETVRFAIKGLAQDGDGRFIYSALIDTMSGLYYKDCHTDGGESHIYHAANTPVGAISAAGRKIAVSMGGGNSLERHISLFDPDSADIPVFTEGEVIEDNPSWSKRDPNKLFYDAAGVATRANGAFFGFGPRAIFKLDIQAKELDELLAELEYDFYKPVEAENGDLYFIRRPYKHAEPEGNLFKDMLLAPFRILRAIGVWLDFFTIRYSGKSLRSGGSQPAKSKEKTPEEIFVAGNIINAQKELDINTKSGDKHPGFIPKSWKLCRMSGGEITELADGVLDYNIGADGYIVFSNGSYILGFYEGEKPEVITKAQAATNIIVL